MLVYIELYLQAVWSHFDPKPKTEVQVKDMEVTGLLCEDFLLNILFTIKGS